MPSTAIPASTTATADIHSLDAARHRRYYIAVANAHSAWQEIRASWALEGLYATDDNAERAGRMLAGELSYVQIVAELCKSYAN